MKRSIDSTQNKNKRLKSFEDNKELGIIDSVCLRNFMCHDHLKFEFDPHINFIIGQNGSGKSAILTGIILALGGKSSATGRYANVKGFIKTGKQKAFLSVTLKNCSDFAYKPNQYGERIIVEREISVDGTSSYKLKSEEGQVVSTLKEELNNVLNAMDIKIENPVLVLTQETSRNFLMSKQGREEKLYEFFYKGTNLQLLQDTYHEARVVKDESAKELVAKKQAINCMDKEIKTWKKLIDNSAKINDLKHELAWANVREMEKLNSEKLERKEELEKMVSDAMKRNESCKNAFDAECEKLDLYIKAKDDCKAEMATQRKSLEEIISLRDRSAESLRKTQGMLERYKREEKKQIEDIKILQNSIQENIDQNENDIYEEREKRKVKIQALEIENGNATLKQKELNDRRISLLKEQKLSQESIEKLKPEVNHYEYKKNSLENEIKQLKNATKNRALLFGEHTLKILEEIESRRHEFSKKPIGPIGLFIEVKDPKWNTAVEACLKPNLLRTYCCDNSQDYSLLITILKKYYGHYIPSVIVSKYLPQMHDVTSQKAQSDFPTVLDMLKIRNPVIANCLIDQLSIENIILIEDIKTAQSVMLDNKPPRNCKSAFLLNCDEILLNPYRHYASSMKPSNMLRTVDQTHIRAAEQELHNITNKIQTKRKEMTRLLTLTSTYPVEIQNIDKEYIETTRFISGNNSQISDLKQYEEPKDISGMQEELESFQSDLKRKQQERKKCEETLLTGKAEYENLNKKIMDIKALVEEERAKFDDLNKKITTCGINKEHFKSGKIEYDTKLRNAEKELKAITLQLKSDEEKTQTAIEKASGYCPRIRTDRSVEEIKIQLKETEKVILEQSNCNREELMVKYGEKFKKLGQAKRDLEVITQYNVKLDSMLNRRERKLREIIKHTQHCLDLAFSVVLKGNGFTGRLDFSKQGCLRLEATPRQENPEVGGQKNCSSLSGGERSFVTIAFLLALWDRIKMPFRILDEYDVFMDSNNRHLSVNLLIKRADFMKHTQFIFLSPLELPEMKESDNIKVHKMPAPKRTGLSSLENKEN